ncbi:MAG: nitroreductase family protein, partial [Desulfobulbaceae bacterium]|nr:nitroreductase family protein [Desulfobulbaceae bacterium]
MAPVATTIDGERCLGCGLCLSVCPADTLSLRQGRAVVSGSHCLACGHCVAICPVGAVTVADIDPSSLSFASFTLDRDRWLAPGAFDLGALVSLMASRRSCRSYSHRPVARELLEDLIKIGVTAPSGTNSQRWTFTVLASRTEVAALGEGIAGFFGRLNRLAANPLLRNLAALFGRPALGDYHRRHYQSVEAALAAWRRDGRDLLFHGATAAILVGSRPGASCPREDALLATQNILLAAHAMGLGSCLIGYAVEALARDRASRRRLNLPDDEPIHAVIALGYPCEPYLRLTGRKRALVRYPGLPEPA